MPIPLTQEAHTLKRSGLIHRFELENLEPLVLLSADAVLGAVPDASVADDWDLPVTSEAPPFPRAEIRIAEYDASDATTRERIAYDPSLRVDPIFSGLSDLEEFEEAELEPIRTPAFDEEPVETALGGQDIISGNSRLSKRETALAMATPIEVLDTRLARPVYHYFNDALDPPLPDGIPPGV